MNNQRLMMKQIEKKLLEWQKLMPQRPSMGWIKTIRKALGMTAQQLGERLGLSRIRIVQLENAEINDAVSLKTLKKAAEALNCELVYALVPKNRSPESLEEIMEEQANKIAEERIKRVAHSMSLEKQDVSKKRLIEEKGELIKSLLKESPRKLWRK